MDARLHALLSRCIYSLHGLDALMRPVLDTVFQSLIVVSYCIPGSAECHAASAIQCITSRALWVSMTSPVVTALKSQSRSSSTALMKSSVTRTELFAFWYGRSVYGENKSPSMEFLIPLASRMRVISSMFFLQ